LDDPRWRRVDPAHVLQGRAGPARGARARSPGGRANRYGPHSAGSWLSPCYPGRIAFRRPFVNLMKSLPRRLNCLVLAPLLAGIIGAAALGCDDNPSETSLPAPTKPAPRASTSAVSSSSASTAAPPAAFVPERVALEEKAMGTSVLLASFTTPELGE